MKHILAAVVTAAVLLAGAACARTEPQAGGPVIARVDVDAEDLEIDVEFAGRVRYGSPEVEILDESGTRMSARISDLDEDSMEIAVEGLVPGRRYTVRVSGVATPDAEEYAGAQAEFTWEAA